MEFINAPIGHNKPIAQPHSQAFYTSRLLPFTSSELKKVLVETQHFDLNITDEDLKLSGMYKKEMNFA